MKAVAERIRKRAAARAKVLNSARGFSIFLRQFDIRLHRAVHRDSREVEPVENYPPIPECHGVINILLIPAGKFFPASEAQRYLNTVHVGEGEKQVPAYDMGTAAEPQHVAPDIEIDVFGNVVPPLPKGAKRRLRLPVLVDSPEALSEPESQSV